MKKSVVPPLLLLILALGSTATLAQTQAAGPRWMFGGGVGYDLPIGSFRDAYNGGLTVAADGCYMFNGKSGLELAAEWAEFPANDDYVSELEDLTGKHSDADFQCLPIMVDFVETFPIGSPVVPYVKGGLGIYLETAEREIGGEKESKNETDFGLNVGAGIRLPIAKTIAIDVGARFHNVMTEDKSTQYLTISAGVGFMF
jgi:opacity protein-like surface antigen